VVSPRWNIAPMASIGFQGATQRAFIKILREKAPIEERATAGVA